MAMAAILVMWPGHLNKLLFPHPIEVSHEIWLWLGDGPGVSEKLLKKKKNGIWRTTEAYLYYKLTNEPFAQVS